MISHRYNVGIYLDILNTRLTGIGNYVFNLVQAIESIYPEIEFKILVKKGIIHYPFRKSFKVFRETNPVIAKLPNSTWYRYFSHRIINNMGIDYLWSPVPFLPKKLNKDIKKIITIYDFNLYIVPETMNFKTYVNYRLFFKKAIFEADKIFTISQGTASKLRKYFKKEADGIIRPGIDKNLFKKLDKKKVKSFLKEKGLPDRYILSVSTLEPRKNIESLIKAFILLKKERKIKDVKLLLAGSSGWKNKNVFKLIDKYRNEIIYTGYTNKEELPYLYNGAEVMVFPSIYEGFGIPVLEARACGTCVITTDIPELKEAGGEGCIYIKPTVENIKKSLEDFFEGKKRCSYKDKNIITWEEEAKKFINLL